MVKVFFYRGITLVDKHEVLKISFSKALAESHGAKLPGGSLRHGNEVAFPLLPALHIFLLQMVSHRLLVQIHPTGHGTDSVGSFCNGQAPNHRGRHFGRNLY